MDTNNPLQQIFLAGVGALAIGAEKSQELIDELVKKGQITVDEGKDIASDLSSRTEQDAKKIRDEVVIAHMRAMTKEQRDEFAAQVAEMAAQIDGDNALQKEQAEEVETIEQNQS